MVVERTHEKTVGIVENSTKFLFAMVLTGIESIRLNRGVSIKFLFAAGFCFPP